jgi:hypothetical protein
MVADFSKITDSADAYLFSISNAAEFLRFGIPPQSLDEQHSATWESAQPLSGGLPRHIRAVEQGLVVQIPSLTLDGYMERVSVNPQLLKIKSMMDRGDRVGFVWADFRISPAVITRVSFTRSMWIDNKCMRAVVDLTLEKSRG